MPYYESVVQHSEPGSRFRGYLEDNGRIIYQLYDYSQSPVRVNHSVLKIPDENRLQYVPILDQESDPFVSVLTDESSIGHPTTKFNSEFSTVVALDFLPNNLTDRVMVAYFTKAHTYLKVNGYTGIFSLFFRDGWNLELSEGSQFCDKRYDNSQDLYFDLKDLYEQTYYRNCAVLFHVFQDENIYGVRIPQAWLAGMISRIRLPVSFSSGKEIRIFYDQQTIFVELTESNYSSASFNYLMEWIRLSLKALYLKGTIILDVEDDTDLVENFNLKKLFDDVYTFSWQNSLIGERSKFLMQLRIDQTITIPFFDDDIDIKANVVRFLNDLGVVFYFLGREIIIRVLNLGQIQDITRNLFSFSYGKEGKFATEIKALKEPPELQTLSSMSEVSSSNQTNVLEYNDLTVGVRRIKINSY